MPPAHPQEQGKLHLAHINGWTVVSMWDRTGDTRGGSCASWLIEGVHTLAEAVPIMRESFPDLWRRIQPEAEVPA